MAYINMNNHNIKGIDPFELDKVYLENCIEAMKKLPAKSVDIAIADPPYNLSKGGNWKWDNSVPLPGFGGDWSKVMANWDNMSLTEYFNFSMAWLTEIKRVVRPTGSLWIHGTYHNIGIINYAMQLLGIEIINEVVWYKRNSFPNLSGRRLTASHETILWAHTGASKKRQYYFDYEKSKEMDCPGDLLKFRGKQMRTVWDIPNNKEKHEILFGKHPTQKPIRLLKRMLSISAKEGDVLLVPFAGAGSDCIAARELGIHFLGFEIDPQFISICNERLDNSNSLNKILNTGNKNTGTSDVGIETLNLPRTAKSIPSIIKWTGSKRSQAASIASLMPGYKRYFEPFLGGGALLYLAAVPGSVAGDIYEPLVGLWQLIKKDPESVIEDYRNKWIKLNEELNGLDVSQRKKRSGYPKFFYTIRDDFNQEKDPLDLNFLMRTCVNGIARFNDLGEFNNSFHLSRRGMDPKKYEDVVASWHSVIQGTEFKCQDYMATVALAEKGDFIYFDPPYAGNNQRYIEDLDLNRFFSVLDGLNHRGVNWALSFDGWRGIKDLTYAVPESIYKRKKLLTSGNSAVNKVLNGPIEQVDESLYLNY